MLKLSNLASRRFFSSSFVLSKNISSKNNNSRLHNLLANMPKEEVHLKDVRKMRMEKRTKRFLVQPANIYWQVLGSGSYGGPTSLYLYTDHRKYLFNCGEGTQRLTSQLSLGGALSQLEHVFITSKTWRHLGGLPGVCLSAKAAGAPDITIHGPPGCMELYQATKRFVRLYEFNVLAHTEDDGVFEDGAVKVEQVKMARSVNKKCPNLSENWEEDEQGELEDYNNTVQAYICHFSPKPGKLDIEKCVDLGVKPGPMLGMLKAGKDVTLDDGRVVRSCDVVGDMAPPSTFLVLDVPDLEYLDSLESSEELKNLNNLEAVFHFSPDEVVSSPRYKQWLKGVGDNVNHILLNESCKGLGLPDVTAYTHKLRMIRGEFFPALVGAQDSLANTEVEKIIKFDLEEFKTTVMQGVTGLKVNVRPDHLQKIDLSDVVRFDEELANKELMEGIKVADPQEREEYVRLMKEDIEFAHNFNPDPVKSLTAKLAAIDKVDLSTVEKTSSSFPVVTFLGTGSSVPSKYRNASGILVETEPGSFLMMDCGEGTISQLVRMRGRVGAERVLMGLKGVYISHMHADHHLGLINIIQLRERAFISRDREVKKLYIISTSRLSEFLTEYHSKFEPVLTNAELVKCEHLVLYNARDEVTLVEDESKKHQFLFPDTLERVLSDLGLVELFTARAIHCPHAFCLAMRTTAGYKLAYSGDTRPCQNFRDICAWGGGPDLLIHEATMEHFMMNDAIIKKHSTFTEAIQEGQAMGAKFTMLTHFSQRYAKMPTLDEIRGKPNVGIAFDNMVVRPDNMKMIPSIYPALARFLWDYQEELIDRAEQYKAKYVEGGALASQLDLEDFESPMEEKKQLAEMLEKRYEDKHQWFLKTKKRKLMMKQQEEEAGSGKKVGKVVKKL
eukprot:TRINITY_DN13097_c0_g1_i2.p1 TRINITY_DN13097_c0_g1~~TRINITY_DN13097_c0_g1_i2.p1  ORF type:complete len:896 (-),score=340.30 TRINITY_DN13097_c0_g1_i2:90-2777(-)